MKKFNIPINSSPSLDTVFLAIDAAVSFCITDTPQKVYILTDSKYVLETLLSYKPIDYYFTTKYIIQDLLLLSEETTKVTFQSLQYSRK